ncbi:MAG: recombinase family protein [Cellulomonas sp.]
MTSTRANRPCHTTYPEGCTVAYLRVSTTEQAESGAGLAAQRAAIEAYAARAGLSVDHWLVDPGVSGSVAPLERPALGEALGILGGCKAGALLVAKSDRIARKTADLLALRDLAERQGWTLSAADGSVDWSTVHGRAMSTVMGAFAELERDLIRARTREGMAAKREAGVRLGRPITLPLDVRQQIAAARADGATFAAIALHLNDNKIPTARGGSRWYPSTVKAVCVSLEHDAYAARASEV